MNIPTYLVMSCIFLSATLDPKRLFSKLSELFYLNQAMFGHPVPSSRVSVIFLVKFKRIFQNYARIYG